MEKLESVDNSKRKFLKGIGTTVLAGVLVPAGFAVSKKYTNFHRRPSAENNQDKGMTKAEQEQYDNLSDSGYFLHEVSIHKEQLERDVAVALSHADIVSQIQNEFQLPGIPSAIIRQSIEQLMPALAFVESRFNNEAKSSVAAFGVLQIMPQTWDELAKDGEDKADLGDQIKVAARLIEQTYRHIMQTCSEELATIKENYFAGDEDLFDQCFMCPVLMNAYNAGMGTLASLIQKFATKYPTPASTVELFEQSELLTGFDVFVGMSFTANHQEWVAWYKEHATDYTAKIYCAYSVLQNCFQEAISISNK